MKEREDSENKRLFREAEALRETLRAELRAKATNSKNNVQEISSKNRENNPKEYSK